MLINGAMQIRAALPYPLQKCGCALPNGSALYVNKKACYKYRVVSEVKS